MQHRRLKRWMKHHPRYERIFALGWNNIDGVVDCDAHDMRRQAIWIGHRDNAFIHGANIKHVLSGATKSTTAWALPICGMNPVDITEWFWREYGRIGLCLLSDASHDLVRINKRARKCRRCSKHFRREVVTHRIIRRREIWRAA